MDDIYKMKLHEVITPNIEPPTQIIRVPGGWLYRTLQIWQEPTNYGDGWTENYTTNTVFVRFDNEYMEGEW